MKIHCSYQKLVPLDELKPHPRNRNVHTQEQIERLAKIFEAQGIRKPITVSNRSGFITAGHGRLLAATKLALRDFPVDYQDYNSEEEEYADLTADNAIGAWADLDLSGINNDIGELGPFDLDILGLPDFTVDVAEKPKKEKKKKTCPNCGELL